MIIQCANRSCGLEAERQSYYCAKHDPLSPPLHLLDCGCKRGFCKHPATYRPSVFGTAGQVWNGETGCWETPAPAIKYDDGKPRMSLIPPDALIELAKVYTYGAIRYAPHNWVKGMEYSRILDATLRHIMAFIGGEDRDPESGLYHMGSAAWGCITIIAFMLRGIGTDDRGKINGNYTTNQHAIPKHSHPPLKDG